MVRLLILLGINIFIMTGCKTSGHYKNPVIFSGADPWIIKQNGFYYYCCSMNNGIGISKSKNLHQIILQSKYGKPRKEINGIRVVFGLRNFITLTINGIFIMREDMVDLHLYTNEQVFLSL